MDSAHQQSAPGKQPIRVAVIDAHALVAEAFARSLEAEPGLDVRLATSSPEALLSVVDGDSIHVVVLDFAMRAVKGGFDLFQHQHVRTGKTRVVVVSALHRRDDARAARAFGATAFVPKTSRMADVVAAIRAAHAGESQIDEAAGPGADFKPPSRRELQVLDALRSGATNTEIGKSLGISSRTVESHLRRLYARYKVATRSELLVLALRDEWISMDRPRRQGRSVSRS